MYYKMSADMKRFDQLLAETEGAYHAIAQAMGLPDSGFQVLYTLCALGDGSPLSQVVQQAGLPKQTVNSALRKLERERILTLEAVGGRKKALRLTGEGWDLCRQKIFPVLEMEDEVFGAWTQEERDTYLRLTQRYLEDFRERTQTRFGRKP